MENFESPLPALEYMKTCPVDAVLCDIRMPKMSGLEFAKRLNEMDSSATVVILSGYKDFDFLKEAISYRVFDYLLKPVTHNEIHKTFSALREELDRRTAMREEAPESPEEAIGIISAVKAHLEKNYASTSLEETAAFIHMNPNYLSRLFKQKTGENFSEYLIRLKMKKALSLMSNLELKTYHISEMVGYTNPNNFTRAFKKQFGKSPKDYRSGGE